VVFAVVRAGITLMSLLFKFAASFSKYLNGVVSSFSTVLEPLEVAIS
jgi:hypothetical protein